MSAVLAARQILTPAGWVERHEAVLDADGQIVDVRQMPEEKEAEHGILIPAPGNLHSHAFQRALTGLTEARGPDANDTFWSWRKLMYTFLKTITPDQVEAIAAFVQMETLEAGYGAIGEFHYLHHQADGTAFDTVSEMSQRVVAAAENTGIGLTLLPVLYQQGGADGRELKGSQLRFGNDLARFERLLDEADEAAAKLANPAMVGVAPHSLRAVVPQSLVDLAKLRPLTPMHIHVAEQIAEVEEIEAAYGKRPVRWLLDTGLVDARWCLIHATHMEPHETEDLAATGAVAGLCPITEANLGDGTFDGVRYLNGQGWYGVGTDSNTRISLSEELRILEFSQRYRDLSRARLADEKRSSGRALLDAVVAGGARALGRNAYGLAAGQLADIIELDDSHPDRAGLVGDTVLDSWIFASGDNRAVKSVWSAGRKLVENGRHIHHEAITKAYADAVRDLRATA